MRITLLGTGTSTGVPMPGCRCRVCTSTDPRNFRDRTSALIECPDGRTILIDATPDLRHQAIKHSIQRVDAVIFTHAHSDHILGTDDLRSFNFVHRHRIPCFGAASTIRSLRSFFRYIFEPNNSYQGGMLAQLDLVEISNDDPFEVLGVTVNPFAMQHGSEVVTGIRIGDMAYATDCKTLSDRASEQIKGVAHLFLDGLRYEPHATHLTIPEAIGVAQSAGAAATYLIHTTHTVEYQETSAKLPAGVVLGYDGLSVEFDERWEHQ